MQSDHENRTAMQVDEDEQQVHSGTDKAPNDDPNHPYFSKVCFVCGEKSKDDALLATHYGGR